MKRLIPFAIAVFVLFGCLVLPASATEIDNSDSINLLDYYNPGLKYTSTGRNYVSLIFPGYLKYEYIDIVVQAPTGITAVYQEYYAGEYELTVLPIGQHCYRIYGGIAYEGNKLDLVFVIPESSGTANWLTILSAFLYKTSFLRFDNDAYCDIVSAEFNSTIHYVPTDEINHRVFTATSDFSNTAFTTYIWTVDWRKYDYIDFQLMYEVFDITSISAVMGNENVPVEYSYIDGTNIDGNAFYISLRLDVTGLDRSLDDYPMIIIMGRLNTGSTNLVGFMNCSGYVKQSFFSPLFYYFYDLKNKLDILFSSATNRIIDALNGNSDSGDSFKNNSQALINDLDGIANVMDSVPRPDLSNLGELDISGSISDGALLMGNLYQAFTSQNWTVNILFASIVISLIAYILFGKE